jgi:serine/threonine-protein kinase
MGEVFAARHLLTGRQVALKVVRPDGRSEGRTGRFVREARIAGALRHPNVVEVLDAFEDDDGAAVLVMELLVGETLAAHQARTGAVSLEVAASILVPVARALLAAHHAGVVHRDLKPENIFLTPGDGGSCVPKVLDFGIAKVLDWTPLAEGIDGQATNTGAIVGTPYYMAFEQAMSEKDVDCRADIWSLGVIFFEMLAGRRPLEFDTLGQMYAAFLKGSMPKVREAFPDLPERVAEVLERCLVIERRGRLAGLESFIEAVGAVAPVAPCRAAGASGGVRESSRPPTAPRRESWRTVRVGVAAGAVALALVAGVGWTAGGMGRPRVASLADGRSSGLQAGRVDLPPEAPAQGADVSLRGPARESSPPENGAVVVLEAPDPAAAPSHGREAASTRPAAAATGSGGTPAPTAAGVRPLVSPPIKKGILERLPY